VKDKQEHAKPKGIDSDFLYQKVICKECQLAVGTYNAKECGV